MQLYVFYVVYVVTTVAVVVVVVVDIVCSQDQPRASLLSCTVDIYIISLNIFSNLLSKS